jgi:hypothetical protein
MTAAGVELYRESFARRIEGMQRPDWTTVDRPGVYGVYGAADNRGGRVLITDDRAVPALEALLPDFHPQVINVFSAARRCREAIQAAGRWDREPATAMICRDLARLPHLPLPPHLTIHTVRRVSSDTESDVALETAAQACLRADPHTANVPLSGFLAFLRSLPDSTRLFAAVDIQREVRATAGCSTFDGDASAYFVTTDPHWRGRGGPPP